jgi:hypothetical protein
MSINPPRSILKLQNRDTMVKMRVRFAIATDKNEEMVAAKTLSYNIATEIDSEIDTNKQCELLLVFNKLII